MAWWRTIGLSTRIFGILFLLLLTIFGMGLAAIWSANQFNKMISQLIVDHMAALQASREIESELSNQKGFATYYFLDGDTKWLNELAFHRQAFMTSLNKAEAINQHPAQREMLSHIREKYEKYVADKDEVIECYRNGDRRAGEDRHWSVRETFFELNDLCNRYLQANEASIKEIQAAGRLRLKRIFLFAAVFMSVSLALVVLLAFVMVTQILAPIRRLTGEAAATKKFARSGNELGDLSTRVRGLVEDVNRTRTELEQSQELLLNSEKMALVGKLATEVAHSIRNPMTSINMRLFSLKRNLSLTDVQQEDFEVVAEEMRRLDTIVRNFLEFSKPHKLKKQRLCISDVIDTTLELLSYRLNLHSVTVVREQGPRIPSIEGDPALLKEVFVNLLVNACEAMENGGEIAITEEEALAENIGRAVLVKVRDNGPGMSEELQKRALEPFETTKPEGTGLGLFIAVRIIKEHGGHLSLFSREGEGTTFAITLPASEEAGK